MKICVSAAANSLDAPIDPRFGRCPYFVIVDSETMQFEAVPNMASGAMGGAGIQAAQTIANKGTKVLITGNVGPNAFQALSAAGIKIVTGASGTVREVVEKYKRGELSETGAPTVRGHFGMGTGRGSGRGRKDRGRLV
jgi:predicted Fe-Mo cluster-binding NifX family protein